MDGIASRFAGFFVENAPTWRVVLIAGPIALAWAYAGLSFAGWLKQRRGLRTGDRDGRPGASLHSAAVFVAANAAIALAVALAPELAFAPRHLLAIPALALLSTVVEAVSPHGWDNATLELVPAWAAGALL